MWIHIQAGKAITCPATCPTHVFETVIAPCFAVEPAARPVFSVLHQLLRELAGSAAVAAGFVGAALGPLSSAMVKPTVMLDLSINDTSYILPSSDVAPATLQSDQQLRMQYLSQQPSYLFTGPPSSQPVSLSYLQRTQAPLFKEDTAKVQFSALPKPALSAAQSTKFANYLKGLPPAEANIGMFQNPLYTRKQERPRGNSLMLNTPLYSDEHT